MTENRQRQIPLLLWPFYGLWRLLTLVLNITGRIVCAIIGFTLLCAGSAITMSVIGAPLGIPLAAVGVLLLVRALF